MALGLREGIHRLALGTVSNFTDQNTAKYSKRCSAHSFIQFLKRLDDQSLRSQESHSKNEVNRRNHQCITVLMIYPLVNVYITMENHHFSWENPLFLWPFSIAILTITRGYQLQDSVRNSLPWLNPMQCLARLQALQTKLGPKEQQLQPPAVTLLSRYSEII